MRLPFPSILTRYLAMSYVRTAIATLVGVVSVVLVVDFADRAYSFRGAGWVTNVIRLYANLSIDLAYQVAPSALLLAAGITASALRQQGELTAFHALGNPPRRIYAAILATCALGCAALVTLNDWVVVDASRKADEIKAASFRRPADFSTYFGQQHWFRSGDRIYNLRGSDGDAFTRVSLFEVTPSFALQKRIDAERMEPQPDGGWLLRDATVSNFDGGARTGVERLPELSLRLPESASDFRLKVGYPNQMSLIALVDQIGVREKMGLPTAEYTHELHNRIAYPFAAVPGAFLALLLALRKNRKGHLATALAEGILVSLCMFTLLTIFRAVGHGGSLPPALAAWMPVLLLGLAGVALGLWQQAREAGWRLTRRVPVP